MNKPQLNKSNAKQQASKSPKVSDEIKGWSVTIGSRFLYMNKAYFREARFGQHNTHLENNKQMTFDFIKGGRRSRR